MRSKYSIIIILVILVLQIVNVQYSNGNGSREEVSRGQLFFDDTDYEYRSMWVEGYQIINISEVKAVVEIARKYNFNTISPLINGDWRGVFYNSSYFPRHPDIAWHFDPLMELIKEAHKFGIQIHPWWHTLYGYPILLEHPEWRCQTSSGAISTAWINPAIPEAREFVRDFALEMIMNYPVEGIKLDTIRYGGSSYSYDPYTVQKYADSGMTDFGEFRRLQITETVEMVYDAIMEVKPWVWVGADVFSTNWGRLGGVFQDPEVWFSRGIIDYITPMIYTTSESSYNYSVTFDLENMGGPVVAGTYVYIPGNTAHGSVPSEEVGIEKLVDMVTIAQNQGAWGICAFAYKFLRQYPSYGQALKEGPFSEKARCPIKEQDHPTNISRWYFEKDHDRYGWNLFDSGHFYPNNGVWSISGSTSPKLLSPRLNITATGTNVIEISALIEEDVNCTLKIYWGQMAAVLDENRMIERSLVGTGEWKIYSIHLDESERWMGVITYLTVVPFFGSRQNITIDQITLHWMPYCIREVSYLGPFTVGGPDGLLDRPFIMDEGKTIPRQGDIDGGREWEKFSMERDLIDFRFPLGRESYSVVYSHVLVKSPESRRVQFRIGSSDGIKVWLNGDLVTNSYDPRSVSPDQNISSVWLGQGFNSLFIKMAVYTSQFSYYIRFTNELNETMDDLQYFSHIPYPSAPVILNQKDIWYSENSIDIQWSMEETISRITSFEIILDDNDPLYTSEEHLNLEGLENGDHTVRIRAFDELGETGPFSEITFGTDNTIPMISDLQVFGNYSTNGKIEWDWELLDNPVSKLEHYEILISHGPVGSLGLNDLDAIYVSDSKFVLNENIVDGHRYIARVKAVSRSGNYYISDTSNQIIVDMTPPSCPQAVRSMMVDKINRTYKIEWEHSTDNIEHGRKGYIVYIDHGNNEWNKYMDTVSSSFTYSRPIGNDPSFKIRSFDRAGNLGESCDVFSFSNHPPVAHFDRDVMFLPGEVIIIDSGLSYDLDGEITSVLWKVDGELVSTERNLSMNLEEGAFDIELLVFDDRGMNDSAQARIVLRYDEGIGTKPLRTWLVENSWMDDILPVINITIPVYPEPEPVKEDPYVTTRSSILRVGIVVFIVIMVLSFIISSIFSLSTIRRRRYSKMYDEEFILEDEEEKESHNKEKKAFSPGRGSVSFKPAPAMYTLEPHINDEIPKMEEDDLEEEDDDLEEEISYEEMDIEDWEDVEDIEDLEEIDEIQDMEEFDEIFEDEMIEFDEDVEEVWV